MNSNITPPIPEIDVPFEKTTPPKTSPVSSKKLEKKEVENYERIHQIARKNLLTKSGLKLLIYILLSMLFLVCIDTIVVNFGLNSSEHLETVIDFGKYTATILLGSLFATKTNEHD